MDPRIRVITIIGLLLTIGIACLTLPVTNMLYWSLYVPLTTIVYTMHLIFYLLFSLLYYIFLGFCTLVITFSIFALVATRNVPSEESFRKWLEEIIAIGQLCNNGVSGVTRSNFITRWIERKIVFHTFTATTTFTFLNCGVARVAFGKENNSQTNQDNTKPLSIALGIFNTWIPIR